MSEWGLEASHLSTIPCSLQKYTELLQHSQKPSDLSLAQRQLAFRYWVAYELYGDTRQHSRKSFACPLLGCSIAFDNFASCLAHLTECAWLLNAWYWCPFCNQPERFTVPELRLTTPGSTEASSTEFKHAHSSDQRRTNAKSGAARFLMNVGSKLGFKKPSLSSRIGAGMNSANRNVQDRTPSSLPISRPTGIVPELPETVFPRELHSDHMLELSGGSQRFGLPHSSSGTNMDRWILPNKDYLQGLQSPAIASSGFPPETMGVPTGVELDTNPLLLAELSGDCINGLYYPETMELPTNVDGTCQPLDPMGAAAVGADQSARFSQPVPILSNYSTRSGISCHSRDVFVQMERLPVYTQDTRFDHVYSPETLQTESFRSNASGTSLPLYVGPSNSTLTNASQTHRQRALLGPQPAQIRDQFSTSSHPSVDEFQPSMNDRAQPVLSTATTFPSVSSQEPSSDSPKYSAWCRFGDARRFISHIGSSECLGPYQSHNASPEGTIMALAGENEMIDDSQEQNAWFSLLQPTHTRGTPEVRDQLTPEKPLPRLPNLSFDEDGPSTSPAESIRSTRRNSDGTSTSSNNTTLPTSAGTSPISLGMPPNIHATASSRCPKPPETSQCLKCDTVFTGSFQDRRSNLNRHVRFKHGSQEKFPCPTEGCNKVYLRPDNLLKHRRAEHQHIQPLKRSNARKVIRDF